MNPSIGTRNSTLNLFLYLWRFPSRKFAFESVKSFDITATKNSPATGVISLNGENRLKSKKL